MKQEAIKRLKALKIEEDKIKAFEEDNTVYKSKTLTPILLELTDDEKALIRQLEKQNNVLVYHLLEGDNHILSQYELLFVTNEKDIWEREIEDIRNDLITIQLILIDNKSKKVKSSEVVNIGIRKGNGGLIRVC